MVENIKLTTEIGQSYWTKNGAYQKEMDELWTKLVPHEGTCDNVHGELIRNINRILYDFHNNGGGNFFNDDRFVTCPTCQGSGEKYAEWDLNEDDHNYGEVCEECWGEGEVIDDKKGVINIFFLNMFNFIEQYVPNTKELIAEIKEMIRSIQIEYNDLNINKFDRVADEVVFYVLNNENKQL